MLALALLATVGLFGPDRTPQPDLDLVAVDVFANQTGDPALDPVGAMAGHWLVQSLHGAGLRVVPFDVSLAVGRGAERAENGRDRLRELSRAAGARIVVSGAYFREEDRLRFLAEVADVVKGEVLFAPRPIEAPVDSPSMALTSLRIKVRDFLYRYLNTAPVLDTIPGSVRPPSYDAYRRFLLGMDHFVNTEWAEAASHFEAAARLDPGYPPFRYMSAIALENEGRAAEAARYIAGINQLDDQMTPYDRATVEWLVADDPAAALHAARRMTQVGPSYVGYFLVALHSLQLNRPAEALEVLARPNVGSLLAPDWPPYWQVRVDALHALGRYQEELRVAGEALRQHPDVRTLVGIELPALAALGRTDEVLSRSKALLRRGSGVVPRLITAGDELDAHGDAVAARRLWERVAAALRLKGQEGYGKGRAVCIPLVSTLERLDQDSEARALLACVGRADSLAWAEDRGILSARRGDRAGAEAAMLWLSHRPPERLASRRVRAQARIAAELGEKAQAIKLLGQALRVSGDYGSLHRDPLLRQLRDQREFRELARPAS